jgi:hypothetical protein
MRRLLSGSILALALAGCSDSTAVGGIVLQIPSSLFSTSLNGAVHLAWSDNPFINAPADAFLEYRVFSTVYSIDSDLCGEEWSLEGSTIAPEFIVGALENGMSWCYAVVSVSVDGLESEFSPIRADTPRPDARNVIVYAYQASQLQSGFKFWDDLNGNGVVEPQELGIVTDGNRTDIDFWVDRDAGNVFWMVPEGGSQAAWYIEGSVQIPSPIADLTSIDIAPVSGYAPDAIQAEPMFGYVFQMDVGDGFARFGGIRVTHVGRDWMILDWSYQTDPGNPELSIHGGLPVARESGITIRR